VPLPYILDNRSDDTRHARGLRALIEHHPADPLAVATGYVNLEGLSILAELSEGRPTRLLLGAQPDPGLGAPPPPRDLFESQLRSLGGERDFSRFPPSRAKERLEAIESWLRRPEVEVRRYTHSFLHGKAYLIGTVDVARAALVTSANLTGAGLHRNMELGLTSYGPPAASEAIEWFEALWAEAVPFEDELRELLFPSHLEVDPYDVYLRALLELHGPLEEDRTRPTQPSGVRLADFQRDGYERARAIAKAHGGVIFADGVGTGKTEIGLAFIEERIKEDGVYALVVCPAQLKMRWQERITQAKLSAQVVSFNELAADEQLAPAGRQTRRVLSVDRDYYRLVVVDEAHALRNHDTTWYRAMERLLGGTEKQVVLLTATPINNGLWDLYNLVMLFARHDRGLARAGIDSIRELFLAAGANERDPENLAPEILYPIADAVSVRRDRAFIARSYPDATFPDGTPVRFPEPKLVTERYDIDGAHPGLLRAVVDGIDRLTMARYRPSAYTLAGEERPVEAQLGGLLRSGLLKRFESCWQACLETVEKMIAAHDAFLLGWERGYVLTGDTLRDAAAAEEEDSGLASWIEAALESGGAESQPRTGFRPEYEDAVRADREILVGIRERLKGLDARSDPKLARLVEILESSPARKVAVFATYGATVKYLDEHLPETVGGRDRVTVIGNETTPDQRLESLARFCPNTVVRDGYEPPDGEVDLLLSTDVLSEGQNLQQAQAVVSYDMPWNPQRVVQRNGRVIRLKSEHQEVFLTTMLPEPGELEELLGLEERIRAKIKAASLYGMESGVIDGFDETEPDMELRNFAERLEAGDETLLDEAEEDSGAFIGEELRRLIDRAAEEGDVRRVLALPWGVGAAFRQVPGGRSVGPPGVFFATRTRPMGGAEDGFRYWRHVPFASEGDGYGDPVTRDLDILRVIDPTGAEPAESLDGVDLEAAWQIAAESIVRAHNMKSDLRREQERVGPRQRWALNLLRNPAVALPDMARAERAMAALSVERGTTIRRAIGEIMESQRAGEITLNEAAAALLDLVDAFGLQPVSTLPPVEPISEQDLGVVCWMVVLP
jgi:superfamily II DNA or RNA helicase